MKADLAGHRELTFPLLWYCSDEVHLTLNKNEHCPLDDRAGENSQPHFPVVKGLRMLTLW